jgi:hypothetical protein
MDKRRGNAASPTVVSNNDVLGQVDFYGYDGSANRQTASILAAVDGTPGASDMPSRLTFWTTPDGTITPTERMRITQAGNVGIGTSSPTAQLSVAGNAQSSMNFTSGSTAGGAIGFRRSNGSLASPTIVGEGSSLGFLQFYAYDGAAFQNAAQISVEMDGIPGAGDVPARLMFATTADGASNPTERMRITNAGNVGIGTSSPSHPLHVYQATANAIIFTQSGTVSSYAGYAASAGIAYNGTSTDHPFATLINNTERMRINNAGLITGTGTSLGAWTAYTPTLTNWTLGNGVAEAAYCQIGKVVHYRAVIVLGSTTSVASFPIIGVPVNARNTTHLFPFGGNASDVSASSSYGVSARWASASSVAIFATGGTNGIEVAPSSTVPFTWATGDTLAFAMTYEAA